MKILIEILTGFNMLAARDLSNITAHGHPSVNTRVIITAIDDFNITGVLIVSRYHLRAAIFMIVPTFIHA